MWVSPERRPIQVKDCPFTQARSTLRLRRMARATFRFLALSAFLLSAQSIAQERGFALHRYAGPSAGSSLFLLDRPWYSDTRFFAVGLTFDYSHRPLEPGVLTGRGPLTPIVSNAVLGHVELAGSLFDRLLLSASLPVNLLEIGTTELVSQVGPLQSIAIGDPRVGLMVRVGGQADRDPFSLHLGADVWIPIGAQSTHQGDSGIRLLPRAVFAGAFGVGRYTVDLGFLYRTYASLGPPGLGMIAAPEARVGFALGVSLAGGRLNIGPEAQFAMQVVGDGAFVARGMNLEVLGGANYLIADTLFIGVAGGTAFFGAAGTPDARAIVRIAFAPRRSKDSKRDDVMTQPSGDDADFDGVSDVIDRCPFEPETKNGVRDSDGCPEFEMEPGTPLARVLSVEVKALPGKRVDPLTPPLSPLGDRETVAPVAPVSADSDGDGVPDELDRCPVTPEDLDGFEDEDGCPEPDNDGDSLADSIDTCPFEAETNNGNKDDDGCPDIAPDEDKDGIADAVDRCPFEPENIDGVRDEDGCPEFAIPAQAALSKILSAPRTTLISAAELDHPLDSDNDGVIDAEDRCPVTPEDRDGFEDEDGCPELDNDSDGIVDAKDTCPDDAETLNGFKDDDGCPDERPDVDGDGFDYEADRCPLEPGTAPDGCPHLPLPALALPGFAKPLEFEKPPDTTADTADFDRDGTPDEADSCPVSPEDRDGFEDDDGCPEPDNDHDGIVDSKDKCPFEAETINGVKDDDGCPDRGLALVHVRAGDLVIDDIVRFKPASASLDRTAPPLLQQVAATLRAAASLTIEIDGHTDDVGSSANNIRLSQKRAETIRAFLIKAGVAANRLVAKGFGPTRPKATNKTAAGREQNRRVEFLILGEAK